MVLEVLNISCGVVPVYVDEVDVAAVALVYEALESAEAGGGGRGDVGDSGRTEIHHDVEVCERLHVFLPAGYGVRDTDA
jgi:hypothetical protein